MVHAGIDFGARRSGKTVICIRHEDEWILEQSKKDADADAFVDELINQYDIEDIFIDAPLSLPLVYSGGEGDDYFYRNADRQASAMSPMFLGGLTARAIRLKDSWVKQGRRIYESYPAGLVREYQLGTPYKKDIDQFLELLQPLIGISLPEVKNWHQADALLAWSTGLRTHKNEHVCLGDPAEGVIYI